MRSHEKIINRILSLLSRFIKRICCLFSLQLVQTRALVGIHEISKYLIVLKSIAFELVMF